MKRPAFLFYVGDWMKDPAVRMCSPAARGIWIDAICAMYERDDGGRLSGTYEQLAQVCHATPVQMREAVRELRDTGAATVVISANEITLICRRLARSVSAAEKHVARQKKYREKMKARDVFVDAGVTLRDAACQKSDAKSDARQTLINQPVRRNVTLACQTRDAVSSFSSSSPYSPPRGITPQTPLSQKPLKGGLAAAPLETKKPNGSTDLESIRREAALVARRKGFP